MAIKKIKLDNFKSFRDTEVELGQFNVLIGANASGKSNFIQAFKFFRDIAKDGLENAISMQGGAEYLQNLKIKSSRPLSFGFSFDSSYSVAFNVPELPEDLAFNLRAYESNYEFALSFRDSKTFPEIAKDDYSLKCEYVLMNRETFAIKHTEPAVMSLTHLDDNVVPTFNPQHINKIYPISKSYVWDQYVSPKKLLLESSVLFQQILKKITDGISLYDFDPKLPKQASKTIGKAELEENGENLSIVLNRILHDEESERKLHNLLRELLEFVDKLEVKKRPDKSLLFNMQEKYFKKRNLPASLISDGTVNITALIVALYFEEKSLVIIEEPERNIHPFLISRVVEMMKDASKNKQIIVTTHNPEVVKYAGIENLLLMHRDKDGFSVITRPKEKKEVQTFLKNEIGIEEIYIQQLL